MQQTLLHAVAAARPSHSGAVPVLPAVHVAEKHREIQISTGEISVCVCVCVCVCVSVCVCVC